MLKQSETLKKNPEQDPEPIKKKAKSWSTSAIISHYSLHDT